MIAKFLSLKDSLNKLAKMYYLLWLKNLTISVLDFVCSAAV